MTRFRREKEVRAPSKTPITGEVSSKLESLYSSGVIKRGDLDDQALSHLAE